MWSNIELKLEQGKDVYSLLDLIVMAFRSKDLQYEEGHDRAMSKAFATYEITPELLHFLSENGLRCQPRKDKTITIADTTAPTDQASNYWNFRNVCGRNKPLPESDPWDEFRISLSAGLEMAKWHRGLTLIPRAYGTFISPADPYPHWTMFRVLVQSGEEVPAVARDLAANGRAMISWTDLGLGGLRSISRLFEEFSRKNQEILHLAHLGRVFLPDPELRYKNPGDELYIAEPAQPQIFEVWQKQLENYREKLAA